MSILAFFFYSTFVLSLCFGSVEKVKKEGVVYVSRCDDGDRHCSWRAHGNVRHYMTNRRINCRRRIKKKKTNSFPSVWLMAFACLIFLLQKRSWWKKKNAFVRLFFLFSFLAMQVNCAWITLRAGSLSFQLETSHSLLSSYYITPFPPFSCLKTKKKHRVKKSAFFLVLPLHKKKKKQRWCSTFMGA